MNIEKQDWNLFKTKLPLWQERYMESLNLRYIEILNGPGNSSEKFWALEENIKIDKCHPGVRTEVTRQNMLPTILRLLRDGAISADDMSDFSEEFKELVFFLLRR